MSVMLASFYENFSIPDSCRSGSRVSKKLLQENAKLSATDKKAISEDIESIHVHYEVAPETINIPSYEDDTREYLKVFVLQVVLRSPRYFKRIGEIVQRAIPSPVLVVFSHGEELALNAAEKRINQADRSQLVVERFHDTGWLDAAALTPWQASFLEDFIAMRFSYANYWAFYSAMVDRIVALNCAEFSREYTLDPKTTGPSRVDALNELRKLHADQEKTRNTLKKETQFNRQVDLNMKLKELEQAIEACMKFI